MVLGVLLPRIEGSVKLGPGGLEFFLQAVAMRSEEARLDEEEQQEALQAALQRWSVASLKDSTEGRQKPFVVTYNWDRWLEQNLEQLADDVVHDVAAMHPIAIDDVPEEALEAICKTAGLPENPTPLSAERRGGRGAPRWRINTDAGVWRVSNTKYGWTATRDDAEEGG